MQELDWMIEEYAEAVRDLAAERVKGNGMAADERRVEKARKAIIDHVEALVEAARAEVPA